jgi:CelD/BcsL family acetyltransferase involved in cellulose biosynthesis
VNEAAHAAFQDRAQRQLQVDLIADPVRLPQLGAAWESLNACQSDHEAPFFQSHAWNLHVARVRAQRSAHRYRLCVAMVRDGDRLIGIWPLSLQRMLGAWIARSLDEPFGQFAGVIFERKTDIAAGVAAVLEALRTSGLADGLQLANVIEGTSLYHALLNGGARDKVSNDAVYVDMSSYGSFSEFAESVNKKTRKNLRNLLNRLKRVSEVEHTIADDPLRIRAMLTSAFDARLEWMQEYARTSPAFRDPDFRAIVESLTEANGIHLLGFCFASKASALSTQWGFTYLGRYYAYMSGKNSRFDEFSPGRLHLGMVIEACKNRGIDILELMAPASDYKLTWTDRRRPLHVLVMPFTFRGHALLNILADMAISATRSAARLLPQAVRKRILNTLLNN